MYLAARGAAWTQTGGCIELSTEMDSCTSCKYESAENLRTCVASLLVAYTPLFSHNRFKPLSPIHACPTAIAISCNFLVRFECAIFSYPILIIPFSKSFCFFHYLYVHVHLLHKSLPYTQFSSAHHTFIPFIHI